MTQHYGWAVNQDKLQRAIGQAHREQQPEDKMEERVKELYVSYDGLLQKTDEDLVDSKAADLPIEAEKTAEDDPMETGDPTKENADTTDGETAQTAQEGETAA